MCNYLVEIFLNGYIMLWFSNSVVHLVQSLGQIRCQQGVQNFDRQLPIVAVQPGYLPELEVLVPTRLSPSPVGQDRLLHLDGVIIQLDPSLWP